MERALGPMYPTSAALFITIPIKLKAPIALRRISCSLKPHQLFHHFSSESRTVKITFCPFGQVLSEKNQNDLHKMFFGQPYPIDFLPHEIPRKILINIEP